MTSDQSRRVSTIVAELAREPDVALRVWADLPGAIARADVPVAQIRTLSPEVKLYARTDNKGETLADTVLCAEHVQSLGVQVDPPGWFGAAAYTARARNGEIACVVCGAGDPANDQTVAWCPVCDSATTLYEIDYDHRDNEIHVSIDHADEPGGTVAPAPIQYETFAYRCQAGHVLTLPEGFEPAWV